MVNIPISSDAQSPELEELNRFLDTTENGVDIRAEVVHSSNPYWTVLIFCNTKRIKEDPVQTLSESEKLLYEQLRDWRFNKASEENLAPYVIAHNKHLVEAIKIQPKSVKDLERIEGWGQSRVEKYGQEILNIIGSESQNEISNENVDANIISSKPNSDTKFYHCPKCHKPVVPYVYELSGRTMRKCLECNTTLGWK